MSWRLVKDFPSIAFSELSSAAKDTLTLISTREPFIVWMHGNLGAGKTALTSQLMYHAGFDARIPVQSPTYTYANEYIVDGRLIYHLDLYRNNGSADLDHLLDESPLPFRGAFVEWPESHLLPGWTPTHKIEITSLGEKLDAPRRIQLFEWQD